MQGRATLVDVCRRHAVRAVYLFGSRAHDGLRCLEAEPVAREGSDLDVAVLLEDETGRDHRRLASLQTELEDIFEPLRVDLVPLQRVDPLLQFAAIDGHRVFASDSTKADRFELVVMRRAAEALPLQRQLDRMQFGFSNR